MDLASGDLWGRRRRAVGGGGSVGGRQLPPDVRPRAPDMLLDRGLTNGGGLMLNSSVTEAIVGRMACQTFTPFP